MPKGSHVLMADDDKMLIDMYKERLELAGYKVTIARNGEEALAKIRELKPDIVMLDIMMPKVNGYEALASVKSDPQTKSIPVIMLSALMRDFNREKAVEAGADDYLIKSEAMPSDVITKIEQVLSKYGKGSTPAPGTMPPNIPSVTAQVPSSPPPPPTPPSTQPPVPPSSPIPPPKIEEPPKIPNPEVPPKEEPSITPPSKIIFEPEKKVEAKVEEKPKEEVPTVQIDTKPVGMTSQIPPHQQEEEVPIVKINPPVAPPNKPVSPEPIAHDALKPQSVNPKKEASPASIALIVVIAILLTALINDLIIYYFFFIK